MKNSGAFLAPLFLAIGISMIFFIALNTAVAHADTMLSSYGLPGEKVAVPDCLVPFTTYPFGQPAFGHTSDGGGIQTGGHTQSVADILALSDNVFYTVAYVNFSYLGLSPTPLCADETSTGVGPLTNIYGTTPDGTYYWAWFIFTDDGYWHYSGFYTRFSIANNIVTGSLDKPFYAEIKNMGSTTPKMYSGPSTSSSTLKTLPQHWVVYIASSTDASGQLITDAQYQWYQVQDPTDGITGWMPGATATGSTQYLYYDANQAGLIASSTSTGASSSPDTVLEAIDHYYNNSSTTLSLYSSDDYSGLWETGTNHSNDISVLKERGIPEKVILATAAWENQVTPGTGFDNEIVSNDYGLGAMQISTDAWYEEAESSTGTYDNRGKGSGVTIPDCASYQSSNYENCFANAGTHSSSPKSYQPYVPDTGKTYKYYSNTPQSVYANVKDGMTKMADVNLEHKVCDSDPSPLTVYPPDASATTTFNCLDREIVDVVDGYNGFGTNPPYLMHVADRLVNIGNYFNGQSSVDASTTDIINKMYVAASSSVWADLHSPGELSIQDSRGKAIGVVNGQIRNDFTFAAYYKQAKSAVIHFPTDDNLTFKVVGTRSGPYRLDISITKNGKIISFKSANVETKLGQVDTYSMDRDVVQNYRNGVIRKTDYDGNGTVDSVQNLDASVQDLPTVTLKSLPETPYIPIVLPSHTVVTVPVPTPTFTPEKVVTETGQTSDGKKYIHVYPKNFQISKPGQ